MNFMPKTIWLTLSCFIFISCSEKKEKASEGAKEAQKIIAATQSGKIRTTVGGYTLNARIDGKLWAAKYMYPPEQASRIVGENDVDGISIGLPYDRRDMVLNNKIAISHNNAVDLFMPDGKGGIMGGYEGEIEITAVSEEWAEGRFEFTATGDNATTVKVTEGYFRIALK
jgi:hypothetical protein